MNDVRTLVNLWYDAKENKEQAEKDLQIIENKMLHCEFEWLPPEFLKEWIRCKNAIVSTKTHRTELEKMIMSGDWIY